MKKYRSIYVNKPTFQGFEALKKCMYELTGNRCYLLAETFYSFDRSGKVYTNLISNFWYLRNQILDLVKKGHVCQYPLINLGTGKPSPYIYNRLIFSVK